MNNETVVDNIDGKIEQMFSAGAHYGYKKSRRHPSVEPYIFGLKNSVEIFDLTRTSELLERAREFVFGLAKEGKTLLMVGTKFEARLSVREGATSVGQPFAVERWIGGSLTNLPEIRKRIERYKKLIEERQSGEVDKYTKKEKLLLEREMDKLERNFGGIVDMEKIPDAVFIVDPREESTALREAKILKIPVVALAGSDCDITKIEYPIAGNDGARASIAFFVNEIVGAYLEGKKTASAL
jgi:small subunit ribosomal protein S2